jgi:hypothetical protein
VFWLAPARNLAFAAVTNRGDESVGDAVDAALLPLVQHYAP